jgi:hypothetical protein
MIPASRADRAKAFWMAAKRGVRDMARTLTL